VRSLERIVDQQIVISHYGSKVYFMKKKIPNFKNETEERRFWQTHDSADFMDWGNAETPSFPKLKPSTQTISLRLPEPISNA
jgi:hypothetical protein